MDDSNMFTVTPMSQRVELNAGDFYEGDVIVANPANAVADFHYKVRVSAYGVLDETYVADFLIEGERSQIVEWTTIDNPTGVLKPNESVKVHYKIQVPENAPAGGQYAAFLVSSAEDTAASNSIAVSNVFEMASILYARINGELLHGGEIIQSGVPGFVTATPIMTSATFRNDGNIHELARIGLEVRSFFSSEPIYPKAGESGIVEEVIMPGTTRHVIREIDGVAPLGIYDVVQTVNYMGDSVANHQTVIVCPIWFMGLVLVTLIALVLFIVRSVKKRRIKGQAF